MNNFTWAVQQMEKGAHVRRADWALPEPAYVTIGFHEGVVHFLVYNRCPAAPSCKPVLYDFTYTDYTSGTWELVV